MRGFAAFSCVASFVVALLASQAPALSSDVITMTVAGAPGGSVDQIARIMQSAAQRRETVFVITNKAGGNGRMAYHRVRTAESNHLLVGRDLATRNVVAAMARIDYALWARGTNNDLGSFRQRAANDGFRVVVRSRYGAQIAETLSDRFSGNPLILMIVGKSDAAKFLASNDDFMLIDTVRSLSEKMRRGDIRPLLQFSETRNPALPDVPTAVDENLGMTTGSYMLISASDASDGGEVRRLHAFFKKMFESDAYQQRCAKTLNACDQWLDLPQLQAMNTDGFGFALCPNCGGKGKTCGDTCPSACNNNCTTQDNKQCCNVSSMPRPPL